MKASTRRLVVLAAALAAAATLAGAESLLIRIQLPKSITSGTAAIGGPFTLVTMDGKTVNDRTYRGKWLLIFFGYTFCPDACPTALNNISVALEKLGSEAGKLQPLFVTVDPERDTRSVMADYLKSFNSRIVGLTGTQPQVDGAVEAYRVYVAREKSVPIGDDYPVYHSAYLYLMDPQGRFMDVIHGSKPGDEIAAWLRTQLTHPNE